MKRWMVMLLVMLLTASARGAFTDQEYAKHVEKLKETAPAGFSIVIEKPFVVIGDEDASVVQERARQTVGWAVRRLREAYFKKDPDQILDIWLFKDNASYDKHTRSIFHDQPTTPYGYYSSAHRALIMNIETGGGTLVHEIVHPFMHANFPACPAWFNEGMGSLYEQCGDREGRIWGHTNWRLAGLQEAIRKGKVPTFLKLTGLSDEEFYTDEKGIHYAQARYLCYYLQEKGLLNRYYSSFVANQKEDPTGYQTLVEVLGEKEMADFERRWQAWAMKLRFP